LEFSVLGCGIYDVLEGPCASAVAGNVDELLALDLFKKVNPLMDLQVPDQLRAEVVSIVVCHQVWQVSVNLVYDFVY